MANPDQSRRKFLGTALALLTGVLGVGKFLSPQLRPKKALLSVPKAEIPHHGGLVYREERVALIREGDAIYALSLVCTHLGCTVQVTPTGLVCPCHGSSFDRQGRVLSGPADRALQRLSVEARGGFYLVTG
jgi:cytochrome b6-f complex iron-sulfur subunit